MNKYRKKPVVIEAFQWTGLPQTYPNWIDAATLVQDDSGRVCMELKTLEGVMLARPGDWIIRGVKGEVYPCKPDIFEATYEPVKEAQ